LLLISRFVSGRNCPSPCSNSKLGLRQLAFRCFRKWYNSVQYISDIERCNLCTLIQSQICKWVLLTISPLIFMNSYISAMWKRLIDLQTESITYERWSTTMTIWRRCCLILPSKAGTMLTWQRFSIYHSLAIHGEIPSEPIFLPFSMLRKSQFSAPYRHSYIIWVQPITAVCAEVSHEPHSMMYQKMSEFWTLVIYSVQTLKRTGDTRFVNWCSDIIRIYS
jgi:hypothetical protein